MPRREGLAARQAHGGESVVDHVERTALLTYRHPLLGASRAMGSVRRAEMLSAR
jgi:hypothetical protein